MKRGWRIAGAVNGAVALAICAAVVAVALPARQSAPLTVAELAPQATQTKVKGADSPTGKPRGNGDEGREGDRGGSAGGGGGRDGQGARGAEPDERGRGRDRDGPADRRRRGGQQGKDPSDRPDRTGPDAPPDAVPRTRRCVGEPPRQTEDPQSPPCVPGSNFNATNNGGATSKGVTADEIRVAVPVGELFVKGFENHFNTRYEFYGRRLRLIAIPNSPNTADASLADAVKVDQELQAFASANHKTLGLEQIYYRELARRGIISVHARALSEPTSALASGAPYRWSVLPTMDRMAALQAEYVCKGLAGKRPEFGRLAQSARGTREFGLVYSLNPDGSEPDLGDLRQRLEACGAKPAAVVKLPSGGGMPAALQAVSALRAADVTTVVQAVNEYGESQLEQAATTQLYYPEWLFSAQNDPDDSDAFLYEPTQAPGRIGPIAADRQVPIDREPAYQALAEGDPAAPGALNPAIDRVRMEFSYRSLLVIAAGIQAAGPKLTPQSFADGLRASRFPNPSAGQAPEFQAAFGFGPGDFTAVDDITLGWYDMGTTSYEHGAPGAVCYAREGRRYALGSLPADDGGVRKGSCR